MGICETKHKTMTQDLNIIGAALGRIPSGCSILTATHGGVSSGMLASWIQQCSFEPPMVTVCIKRNRPIQELVDGSQRFLLNLIGEDATPMFKHFGKGFTLEHNAFDGVTTKATEYGPAITACVAHLGCAVLQSIQVGDHDLYVAEVRVAEVKEGVKPYVHTRKSGMTY